MDRYVKSFAMRGVEALIIGFGVLSVALGTIYVLPRILGRGAMDESLSLIVWLGWLGVVGALVMLIRGFFLLYVAAQIELRRPARESR